MSNKTMACREKNRITIFPAAAPFTASAGDNPATAKQMISIIKGPRRHQQAGGYTLIELLAATLVLPMVALAAGAIYVYIYSWHERGTMRLERFRQGEYIIEVIGDLVRNADYDTTTIKDIVNVESRSGREIVFGTERTPDWSRVYLDTRQRVLYHEQTRAGVRTRSVLTAADPDIRFYYDNVDNPSAVNIYLCLRDRDNTADDDPACFATTAKWRVWER